MSAADAFWRGASSYNWNMTGTTSPRVTSPGQRNLELSGPEMLTCPIYDASKSNGLSIEVQPSPAFARNGERFISVASFPVRVPWRPDVWLPSPGADGAAIVAGATDNGIAVDWEFLNLRKSNLIDWLQSAFRVKPGQWVADLVHRATDGCRDIERHLARGCGRVSKLDGVLTAQMVADDQIIGPLAFFAVNVQNGPGARFVPPASRVEHPNADDRPVWLPRGDHPDCAPGGSQIWFTWTRQEVRAWAASRYAGMKQEAAFRIAWSLCLADDEDLDRGVDSSMKGFRYVATCSGTAYLETEGCLDATARAIWNVYGFKTSADFKTLLSGSFLAGDRVVG